MFEQFWLFHCGWIRLPRPAFVAGTRLDFPRLPFLAGLAIHPEHGPILIDAPFGQGGFRDLGRFLGTIAKTAGLRFEPEWAVSARVEQLGYSCDEVEHVFLTHMHFDHTGGLDAFDNATVHVCEDEWSHARQLEGIQALRAGVQVEDLLGIEARMAPFEMPPHLDEDPEGIDLLGDGSIRAVGLPGHSTCHVGYRLWFEDGSSLLHAGDAAFSMRQIRGRKSLGYFPRQVAESRRDVKRSLRALRTFHADHPDVELVVSHDFSLGDSCFDGPIRLHDPDTGNSDNAASTGS
jgi:glyoxylase-like metal-dependent hydrolase (beta-lactamase superfamily II)